MHAPISRDSLTDRADAAMADAARLRGELSDLIAAGRAECRRARQVDVFLTGLDAASAISLLTQSK